MHNQIFLIWNKSSDRIPIKCNLIEFLSNAKFCHNVFWYINVAVFSTTVLVM